MKRLYGAALVLLFWLAGSVAAASEIPLIEAVQHQGIQRVQVLLQQGVDVNQQQELDGSTALHHAAYVDDPAVVAALIKAGAKVNLANQLGVTPLMLACDSRNPKSVELLLDAGADPNARAEGGETAVMRAARVGNVQVMKLLLAHGGDPDAKEALQDQTALMWAISQQHSEVARLLVENGADVRARTKIPQRRATAMAPAGEGNRAYAAARVLSTPGNGNGFTPLLFAARVGDLESARVLLEAGADVNDTGNDGLSALTLATVRANVPLALFLLDHGANPNLDGAGYTALHWASGTWESELTVRSITVDRPGEWEILAGLRGEPKLKLVKALLAHGADPNARMKIGPFRLGTTKSPDRPELEEATPLILAAMAGDAAVMRALVEKGADPRLKTAYDGTVLMAAAGLGHVQGEDLTSDSSALEAAKLAVQLGVDPKATDTAGNTALHYAAYMRHDPVVQYLVDQGSPLEAKNKFGETPLWDAELVVQFFAGGTFQLVPSSTGALLRKLGAQPVEASYKLARPRDWPDIAVIGTAETQAGAPQAPNAAQGGANR
jgi:ankyrin repeat protein